MITIDGEHLTIEDVVKVARGFENVKLDSKVKEKVEKARLTVEKVIQSGKTVYGINTGFGELAKVRISKDEIDDLQRNLIRSHSCGVGKMLSTEMVRAMMVLRANSLAKGYSGVRLKILETLVEMLNKRVHPVVPSKGSLGASGDLIPLAYIALAMMGEGKVEYKNKRYEAKKGLKEASVKPVTLKAKEGLALINGTQLMTAYCVFAVYDTELLLKNAQIAGVMSLEALKGTDQAFREELHRLRPHKGQIICAKNLWRLTRKSEIIKSHKDCSKVQDAYTLRCIPQVLGAVYDVVSFARSTTETEINSVTDNPIVLPNQNEIVSGGNFHGQPLALALDTLSIAVATIGTLSERRIARLTDSCLSELPPFLTPKSGLNSGFMLPHYVAASLVNENKILSHPASVDTIPVSANQEDHVSMGATAGYKLQKIIENVQQIIAIEYLSAAQGLEFLKPLKPSPPIKEAYDEIRTKIPELKKDRPLYEDIKKMVEMVKKGLIIKVVEERIGKPLE
ncbi:MAG: histidine ammonia-lyase [Thermoplasmata archaeon]|nr:histidine ammonia-lyase [Thermoplasmata archaeon]